MTATLPEGVAGYLLITAIALVAHESWRWAGALLGRRVRETDAAFVWVRYVSAALVAGLTMRLVLFPAGVLGEIDSHVRVISLAMAAIVYVLARNNLGLGILSGSVTMLVLAYAAKLPF
ncbi:MAG: AzlD domain-containing protein [Alphaproteobacteria bacterium]|nr:AzlD domain-containing protein [Alphaproteobacteria bacterium]